MRPDSTDAAWAAVRAAQTDQLSRDACEETLLHMRRVRSSLDAVEIGVVRRLRQLQSAGASESPDAVVERSGDRSGRDARTASTRDEVCNEMPDVESALELGEIGGGHVDALAAAMKPLPREVRDEFNAASDELLTQAHGVSLDAFQRHCRQFAKHLLVQSRRGSDADELEAQRVASQVTRWVDQSTGMHHTKLELDPIRDSKLSTSINRALARLRTTDANAKTPWQQLNVEALLDAVTGNDSTGDVDDSTADSNGTGTGTGTCAGTCTGTVDRVPEIQVAVSWDWLVGEATDAGLCETENGVPLPVSTVRRLCCDAEILPVVLGGDGEVLDVGRSRRTATRGQRRALRSQHRGCAHPACSVGFDACRIHHIQWWWEHHGTTDLDNLLPLCERHHHEVHEGGWELTMTPDRVATWTRPDGTQFHQGSTIDRRDPAHEETTPRPADEATTSQR